MERLIYNELKEWKESARRKPLLLNGARQVGKTWLLKHFGEREYRKVAYLNCERRDRIENIFDSFDTRRMTLGISAVTGVDVTPDDTLIILDEIQEYPRALTALKYFCEDAPNLHVAVAGSLLGVSLHQGVSFPVGKVNTLQLYPMTFSEFLLAMGKRQAAAVLSQGEPTDISVIGDLLADLLRQYYFVGGMPEAVAHYAETGQPNGVRRIQRQILAGYRLDFSKHTTNSEAEQIARVWDSIPQQLARENKKFTYAEIKKGGRASQYSMAIQWLRDAGLVYQVTRVNKAGMPLRFYEEPAVFKLFLHDVGLLGALMDVTAEEVLLSDNAFKEYNGAFSEQYVLTQMMPVGMPVRYYATNSSDVEIDFLLQANGSLLPIEVKAGRNVQGKSLRLFVERNPGLKGIRFSMLPHKDQGWMENVPLYSVEQYIKSKTM